VLRLSSERYVKGAHLQSPAVIAIHKTASVEDDHLETDVRSPSSGMDPIGRHEALRGPSGGVDPSSRTIPRERLHGSRPAAAILAS
jgi:hypothetical protein